MVKSYEEEKKEAPSGIRIPKEGEESNYRGYGWSSDTKDQAAKTAKSYFDANTDTMRSSYIKGKEKGDPTPEEMSKRLGEADEEAAGIMQRAHKKVEKGREATRTLKREMGLKKGGKVASASKRADGCCVKGKTKGRMV
jgi:hypothetical protein